MGLGFTRYVLKPTQLGIYITKIFQLLILFTQKYVVSITKIYVCFFL